MVEWTYKAKARWYMKQRGMCTYRCIGARRLEQVSKKRNGSITKGRREKWFFIYIHTE